jgi:hypothetical protein
MDNQFAGAIFDPFRLGAELNVKAQLATSGYDLIDQIGVKSRQGSRPAMRDCHLRSSTRRHVSKFKAYIPAPDEQDSSRKLIKLQKLLACGKVFRSRYLQVRWFLASCNDYVPALQDLLAHLDSRWPDEASSTVERSDAGFHEGLFPIPGNGPVKVRLKRINSGQSICNCSARIPFLFIRRAQSTISAAPTSTFLGSHPRSAHVPPNGLESTIATCHPAARH